MFQESLGIAIGNHQVALAYLKGTFGGIKCAASSLLSLDGELPLSRKLNAAGQALKEFMQENRIGNASIHVGIPADLAMTREIDFPAAVRQSLNTTLSYELEKYVPISIDDIYFDHQVIGEGDDNQITVLLVVVKKADLELYLDFCRRIPGGVNGIELGSTAVSNGLLYFLNGRSVRDLGADSRKLLKGAAPLETAQAENLKELMAAFNLSSEHLATAAGLALKGMWRAPVDINLLPAEYRRRPSRGGYYAMVVLAVLVLLSLAGWVGSCWMHEKMVAGALNAELKRLNTEMAGIQKTEERIGAIEARLSDLSGLNAPYIPVSDIFRELTQIIPENVWVRELSLEKRKVRLQGYADSASELISLLEASPLFQEVYFASAIVKEKDGKERFNISLTLESS